jgi:glucose-6-phosphate 1-dehydrogenase
VQITVAETLTVGRRGRLYDATGALRDMVPNHLFQLLSLVAMEPPSRFETHEVRSEKAEALDAVHVPSEADALRDSVRAQYVAARIGDNEVEDYRRTAVTSHSRS